MANIQQLIQEADSATLHLKDRDICFAIVLAGLAVNDAVLQLVNELRASRQVASSSDDSCFLRSGAIEQLIRSMRGSDKGPCSQS